MAQADTGTQSPTGRAETPPTYTHRQILEILSGLMMAMLTAMISTSVVGTALPTIVGDLGGQDQLSWVASASLLTMTASTPLWGKLSDIFGRKLTFQTALVLFVAASVCAGLSQNIGELIGARALQGLGVGGLSALAQVILGDVVPPRQRGRYAGYMGAVFGVSTVAGPLLGGFIVDADGLGWRWCFYVCVPLAVVAFLVIQRVLKLPKVRRDTRLDVFGALTITGAAAVLMLLLSLGGQEFAWNSAWTYGLGAGTVVLLVLAVFAERLAGDPIIPPRLFRNRTFVLASVASLCVGIAMFGGMIYLPQYLQIVKGLSPTGSGLMTIPMVVAMFVTSTTSGQIVTRLGRWKAFPVAGLLLVGSAMFLLSRLHVDSSKVVIGIDVAVLGAGLGLTLQILILAAQNAADMKDLAATTSGVSFFRNLGGSMGVAAFGAILNNRLKDELADGLHRLHIAPPPGSGNLGSPDAIHRLTEPFQSLVLSSFTKALESVFIVGVPVAVIGFVAVLCLKELPLRGAAQRAAEAAPSPRHAASLAPTGTPDALTAPTATAPQTATAAQSTSAALSAQSASPTPAESPAPPAPTGSPASAGSAASAAQTGAPAPAGASAQTTQPAPTASPMPTAQFAAPAQTAHTTSPAQSGSAAQTTSPGQSGSAAQAAPGAPAQGARVASAARFAPSAQAVAEPGSAGPDGAPIGGVVRGADGAPVAAAALTLIDVGGRQLGRAVTGPDGGYSLPTPGPGSYVLIASTAGHEPQAATLVVGDRPVEFDLLLTGGGGLAGTVRGTGGEPVADAAVVVTDVRGEVVGTARSGADGAYALTDLAAGAYTLAVSADGHRPVALPVEVAGSGRTRRDVDLPAGLHLRGTVRDRSGAPLRDAGVTLLDGAGNVIGRTVTGPDGEYAFPDLLDGRYTVIASGYPPVASELRLDGDGAHDFELGHPED